MSSFCAIIVDLSGARRRAQKLSELIKLGAVLLWKLIAILHQWVGEIDP